MPSFTLRTLMSEVTAMVGTRLDMTPSQVSLYVNLAQGEIARSLPMGEMESTTTLSLQTSDYTAPLPGDYDEVIALSRVSSYDSFGYRLLTQVPIRDIDNASEGTATGIPRAYALVGPQAFFYPTASSPHSIILRYRRVPSDMTNLTDVPSIATRFQPAIIYKAAENLFMRTLDHQRAAYARDTYISYMQATPSTQETRSRSERPQ